MDTVILFFLFGIVAGALRVNLGLPAAAQKGLATFLLLAIGLKGGLYLAEAGLSMQLLVQCLMVAAFGALLPLIAFPILSKIGRLPRSDAASIAAHYGSVSIGTYAVAVAFLDRAGVSYESYAALFVVMLELPAILVGIALAKRGSQTAMAPIAREMVLNPSVFALLGGMIIGVASGVERAEAVTPLFKNLFHGVLALYLLDLGITVAEKLKDLRRSGAFLLIFGLGMPLLGATLGAVLGMTMGLSLGGTTLLAVLGGSASYIAAPAAMRMAVPEARPALSIAAALGVTFPFNVVLGIPLYYAGCQALYAIAG